jgi:hypothetical protein
MSSVPPELTTPCVPSPYHEPLPLKATDIPIGTEIKTSRFENATQYGLFCTGHISNLSLKEPGVLPPFLFIQKHRAQVYYSVVIEEGELRLATYNQPGLKAWIRNPPKFVPIEIRGRTLLSLDGVKPISLGELAKSDYWCRPTVTVVSTYPKSIEIK